METVNLYRTIYTLITLITVWDATVLSIASTLQGDDVVKHNCTDVSVARLPGGQNTGATLHAVLRIRDILVRIRIRIRKSVLLTNGFGSGSKLQTHFLIFFSDFKDEKNQGFGSALI
jgi:hypothetical protein